MQVQLACKHCDHGWALHAPEDLVQLVCPGCGAAVLAQVSQDFASALQDAQAQLQSAAASFEIDVHLGTAFIPPAFSPES